MGLSPSWHLLGQPSGPRFGVRWGVLSWDLVGSRGCGIGGLDCRVALKFGRRLSNTAAEMPVRSGGSWHWSRGFGASCVSIGSCRPAIARTKTQLGMTGDGRVHLDCHLEKLSAWPCSMEYYLYRGCFSLITYVYRYVCLRAFFRRVSRGTPFIPAIPSKVLPNQAKIFDFIVQLWTGARVYTLPLIFHNRYTHYRMWQQWPKSYFSEIWNMLYYLNHCRQAYLVESR